MRLRNPVLEEREKWGERERQREIERKRDTEREINS